MKNLKNIFLLLVFAGFLTSCSDTEEKFSGSPVGNLNIVTLVGTISTPATIALTGQKISFTATLPRTFTDTVTVEATSTNKGGGRTRAYVDIMPNQTSATGEIEVAGGSIFNTTFDLALTAIELNTVELGTHYLLTSVTSTQPIITIATGSSSIPDQDTNKLIVKLAWPSASSANNLQFNVDKPSPFADVNVTTLSGGKIHNINNTGTTNNSNTSSAEGDYIFSVSALTLTTTPINMPLRFILRYPDGKVDVFEAVYNNLTVGAPLVPYLKVNKTIIAGIATYTATML